MKVRKSKIATLLLTIAVCATSLLSTANAKGVTVYDYKAKKYVDVEVSRPGSNTGTFSATIAKLLFPPVNDFRCISGTTVYSDGINALGDIGWLLMGGRFCPDDYDFKTIVKPCYGTYQGTHPGSESKKAMENGRITFVSSSTWTGSSVRRLQPGYVYYGWGDCWNRKYIGSSTKTVKCDNRTFNDPKPGVRKMCFYERNHNMKTFENKYFHHT
jgi:hypothetical protein